MNIKQATCKHNWNTGIPSICLDCGISWNSAHYMTGRTNTMKQKQPKKIEKIVLKEEIDSFWEEKYIDSVTDLTKVKPVLVKEVGLEDVVNKVNELIDAVNALQEQKKK